MEPVNVAISISGLDQNFYPQAPHGACLEPRVIFLGILDFYPQAPHGACHLIKADLPVTAKNFYPQAPHGACLSMRVLSRKLPSFLSSGSAWSLSLTQQLMLISTQEFLSSGSAWSLSIIKIRLPRV